MANKRAWVNNSGGFQVLAGTDGLDAALIDRSGTITIGGADATSLALGRATKNLTILGYVNDNITWTVGTWRFAAIKADDTVNGAEITYGTGAGGDADGTAVGGDGGTVSLSAANGGAASATYAAGPGGPATVAGGGGGTGSAAQVAGIGGAAELLAGDAGANVGGGGADGGDVNVRAGNGTGAGLKGKITIADSKTRAIEIGNAADNPTLTFIGDGAVDFDSSLAFKIPSNSTGARYLWVGGTQLADATTVTAASVDIVFGDGTGDANPYHTHAGMPVVTGFDTTTNSMLAGQVGYCTDTNMRVKQAIANNTELEATAIGFYEGPAGSMTTGGMIAAALFVGTLSITSGQKCYISGVTAGSLTNVSPTTNNHWIAEVGVIIDQSNYAGSSTCKILYQPKVMRQYTT